MTSPDTSARGGGAPRKSASRPGAPRESASRKSASHPSTRDAAAPVRGLVFDVGGVLLDWNPRHLYRKLFDEEDQMERFLAEICTMEWHSAHDRGISRDESCARLAAAHPEYADLIWAWGRRSEEMISGPIDGSVELLRELRAAGVPCYALTNMERETYPGRVERYPFMQWFDGTVVSAYEGLIKPDPRLFELLLERFGLAAAETAMIDDSPANLEAARSVGMQTVQFESPEQLRRWVQQAGLLAAAPAGAGGAGTEH